ncbi:conserved hypothetical protein [Desulfosarcina cetonica]|uniref:hypothetical protein n=1 Tax=Desulfosarcina cetonica TaxID=90730 RepID=UPI0006D1274D|nr:hypothetical protein [Desulfosarcina cetonica]VTR69473.1 conserved hypothetical protein [Desulfosarcina cetonica]
MKQKYVVLLDNENDRLSIQEYAELDKEMLSLLCEETYDAEKIKTAMQKDRATLIQALRTHNMYPPGLYTERIADAIVELFQPGANTSAELFFEEREMFESMDEDLLMDTDSDDDDGDGDDSTMDVDDLLDDDIDDGFEEKGIIKDLQKNIQVSDDDPGVDNA